MNEVKVWLFVAFVMMVFLLAMAFTDWPDPVRYVLMMVGGSALVVNEDFLAPDDNY